MKNKVPLAQTYHTLRNRVKFNTEEGQDSSPEESKEMTLNGSYQEIRRLGLNLVYASLTDGDSDTATSVLDNLGEVVSHQKSALLT